MEMIDDSTEVLDRDDVEFEEPKDYHLIGLDDQFTPMDFVVAVLRETCHKSAQEAEKIMMDIHTKGRGIMWTGVYDFAHTKSVQITDLAKKHGVPFKTVVEEVR